MKLKSKIIYLLHGRDDEIKSIQEENKNLKQRISVLQKNHNNESPHHSSEVLKRMLFINLNCKNVYLIDYENIAMLPAFITQDEHSVCYIFVGALQKKKISKSENQHDFKGLHYIIHVPYQKKNALDTLLSFYLGQILSAYTPSNIYIVSNDKDYENFKHIAMYYPQVHYEQITLDNIRRLEQNKTSDAFFQRFLIDYLIAFGPNQVQKHIFIKRLCGSKVHGMETNEIQYALQRMKKMHLIEEYNHYGRQYIRLLRDNILQLKESLAKFHESSYVY